MRRFTVTVFLLLFISDNKELSGDTEPQLKSSTHAVSLTISNYHLQTSYSKTKSTRVKIKRQKKPIAYYSNSTATFNIILSGDIHVNPGPGCNAQKCSQCEKTVKCNQKRFICEKCLDVTHVKCSNSQTLILNSHVPCYLTCNKCLHTVLPFFKSSSLDIDNFNLTSTMTDDIAIDTPYQNDVNNNDITALENHRKTVKIIRKSMKSMKNQRKSIENLWKSMQDY